MKHLAILALFFSAFAGSPEQKSVVFDKVTVEEAVRLNEAYKTMDRSMCQVSVQMLYDPDRETATVYAENANSGSCIKFVQRVLSNVLGRRPVEE